MAASTTPITNSFLRNPREENIVCVVPECRSRHIFRRGVQIRGADDPFPELFLCIECGRQWYR